jgi:nucleoside-diphosphate-sugar epimerase
LARALIVGCGCRGRSLGAELRERGWQVRGTSRSPEGAARIEAAGLEAAIADPDRAGTIVELVGDVAVVVWLLGSAGGTREQVAAVHGPRLERVLEKLVDTPVRGFVYEAAGSAPTPLLAEGRELVERAERTWRLPARMLETDASGPGSASAAAAAVEAALRG